MNESELNPKRVASEKQCDANRQNARHSTGPKTSEGKETCRLNARKHGLRAAITLLPNEDAGQFEQHCENFHRTLRPIDAVETRLVNDVITSSWRLDRAVRNETAVATKLVHDATLLYENDRHEAFVTTRRELPSNPRKFCVDLRNSLLGCEWIIDELDKLIGTLKIRGFWYVSERDLLLNMFGLSTEDLFINTLAYDIIDAFLGAGWSTEGDLLRVQALIRTPAPNGMPVFEYRHRIDSLAKRIHSQYDPEASRAKLIEMVLPEIEKLKKHRALLAPIEQHLYVTSTDRAMVDTSREGELRNRYEGMHRRDMLKAIRELGNYRKSIQLDDFDEDVLILPNADYMTEGAPNRPKTVAPEPAPKAESSPRTEPIPGTPDVVEDSQSAKRPLGIPPVPNHRLNELIDSSIPNLNGILNWADELEAERNAKAMQEESLM